MMRKLVLLLVLLAGPTMAAQAPPAGAAGTWAVDDQAARLVLEVDGNSVSGSLNMGAAQVPILDGRIEGDRITLRLSTADGGRTMTLTGTLKGDEIAFTREIVIREGVPPGGAGLMGAQGPMEFTATRVAPDAEMWSGTIRNAPTQRNPSPNPNPRPVTLSSQKMPTPHWRWRGGEKQIDVRTFTLPMGTFPLNSFELSEDRLAFSMSRPIQEDEVSCTLTRQPEGAFAGTCRSSPAGFNQLITLTPPPPGQNGARQP